ncbi:MAG: flagellar filament outer layer protein FlaA [Spirochaetaceae bacterium]|nr:flagellar filament outer layer protein FlaA [Spirochaetaceae bacterium]
MKHRSFGVFCLLFMALTTLAVFGDDFTVNLESKVLENFDNAENSLYVWRKEASRYAVGKDEADKDNPSFANMGLEDGDFFPKLNFFEIWPMALFRNNRENLELRSLGIWGKFKRMGYNWIDIYPTLKSEGEDAKPYEIPIPGRVRYLDMWVWGSNLNFYVEAYIRDEQGVIHTIYLGNLGYQGWKNLRAMVPTSIPQRRRIILDPSAASTLSTTDKNSIYLKFVKFRVWTTPREAVGNFYVYFDQFKVLTDTFESIYDGDEMTDPDWIRENWETSGN